MESTLDMKLHCVVCGGIWGEGDFFQSSGICPVCFAEWVNNRKRINGERECYSEYGLHNDVDCESCPLSKLCFKDTYGIE